MIFLLLLPVAVALSATALLSYGDSTRRTWWFLWLACPGLAWCNATLWGLACRWASDKRELFTLSVAWDVVTILAFTALPLVAFGVRLGPVAWAGLVMVGAGAVLVKVG